VNIIECTTCGVLYNHERLTFPDIENKDGTINVSVAEWTGEEYVAVLPCRVCGEGLLYDRRR
jgi:hypothetical protein